MAVNEIKKSSMTSLLKKFFNFTNRNFHEFCLSWFKCLSFFEESLLFWTRARIAQDFVQKRFRKFSLRVAITAFFYIEEIWNYLRCFL